MKTVNIKIDKKFIEDCVFDEQELKDNLSKYIKESSEDIVREVTRDVMLNVVKKELKKDIKEKVKSFLVSMSDNELFFREEFREYLVEIAKENRKLIDEKVKVFLSNDNEMKDKLANAIGNDFNNRFFDAIRDGKLNY